MVYYENSKKVMTKPLVLVFVDTATDILSNSAGISVTHVSAEQQGSSILVVQTSASVKLPIG